MRSLIVSCGPGVAKLHHNDETARVVHYAGAEPGANVAIGGKGGFPGAGHLSKT